MEIKVSPELGVILGYARDEAMRTGHYGIGIAHLMLGILRHSDNAACRILRELGVDTAELKRRIDRDVFQDRGIPYCDEDRIAFTKAAHSTVNMAVFEGFRRGVQQAGPEHLLLAIARTGHNSATAFLSGKGIGYDEIDGRIKPDGTQRKRELPRAEDIADALEKEIRRLMANNQIKPTIYS